MDGLGALLAGLAALLTSLAGTVALLRRKSEDDDDSAAAWRGRARAAERRADRYEQLWQSCEHARRTDPPTAP